MLLHAVKKQFFFPHNAGNRNTVIWANILLKPRSHAFPPVSVSNLSSYFIPVHLLLLSTENTRVFACVTPLFSGMNPRQASQVGSTAQGIRRWSIFMFIDHLVFHKARGSPNFPRSLEGSFMMGNFKANKREWSGN